MSEKKEIYLDAIESLNCSRALMIDKFQQYIPSRGGGGGGNQIKEVF